MLSADYVVGFVDGEGCFYFGKNAKYNRPSFNVTQIDRDILHELLLVFGCGHVYYDTHGTHKNVSEFRVDSKSGLRKVIDFFDINPPIIKYDEYLIWRGLTLGYINKISFNDIRFSNELQTKAKELRVKGYTYKKIAEELGMSQSSAYKYGRK